ncbi:cytochrome b/b6 domain-containing protein [uncultured Thiodictyon sp.]|uniref:cytochrome b n=1 Tax=uncultured Thiodictyon sp. TaxID=1846217 RepID=UPI0025F437D6|nr:cytochrome b/b6 domain-containing protein [uncultured Thiodictyon sp.]
MQTNRYGFLRRILHWVVALSTLGLLAVGMLFFFLGVDGTQKWFGEDTTGMLLKYHKSFGLVVLIGAILILRMRRRDGVPPYDPQQPLLVRFLGKIVHWLTLVALIVMPILGVLATSFAGKPVQFFNWNLPGTSLLGTHEPWATTLFQYHSQIGLLVLALVLLHLAGVYVHGRVANDNVNSRMSLL